MVLICSVTNSGKEVDFCLKMQVNTTILQKRRIES